MPVHPDGQHGRGSNSQIRAKGVGKNAVRHDLDGTPGLDSDLQQGEVSQMEAGQQAVQNTQGQPAQDRGALPVQPAEQGIAPPNPVDFALQKIGGDLQVPTQALNQINTAQWLPLLEKMAGSNEASPALRNQYVKMLSRLQQEPFSGSTAVVDKNELDDAVNDAF